MGRYLMVVLGGAAGSVARYALGSAIMTRIGGRFPTGTFVINVSGSFLIGLVMTLLTERFKLHPNLRVFLVVGFLGGYTTFSTFEWEAIGLLRDGARWLATLYVVASVLCGYAAVWLGSVLAARR